MPRLKLSFFLACFVFFASLPLSCRAEPPGNREGRSEPSFSTLAARSFLKTQRNLIKKITSCLDSVKNGKNPKNLFFLLLATFVYGILHALGPGHGKLIIISYFGTNKSLWWHAPLMGFQIAALHVLSAAVLVSLVENISRYVFGRGEDGGLYAIRLISYAAITLVGGFMIWQTRRAETDPAGPVKVSGKSRFLLALSVGIVPCAGALLILFYCLSKGMLFTGIMAVSAMAAGIGLTLSCIGLAFSAAKKGIEGKTGADLKKFFPARLLRYVGPALVTGVGAGLFISGL